MKHQKLILASAKSRPDKIVCEDYNNIDELNAARNKYILYSIPTKEQVIQVVDKTSPHSLLGLMVTIKSNNKTPLSFNEVGKENRSSYLSLFSNFFNYCHSQEVVDTFGIQDYNFRISANIAKVTEDRFSIQGERSFHVHMVCYPDEYSNGKIIDLNRKENWEQKFSVIDPLARIGSEILLHSLRKVGLVFSGSTMSTDLTFGEIKLPSALYLKFNSWDVLKTEEFSDYLLDLENHIEKTYSKIVDLLFSPDIPNDLGCWRRRKLLTKVVRTKNINESDIAPECVKNELIGLSNELEDLTIEELEKLKIQRINDHSVGRAEYCLPYAGPTFTYTFFSPGTIGENTGKVVEEIPMYLAITLLIRRTAGAGGLFFNDKGELIKVSKNGGGIFSDDEMRKRKDFQQEYIKRLLNNVVI